MKKFVLLLVVLLLTVSQALAQKSFDMRYSEAVEYYTGKQYDLAIKTGAPVIALIDSAGLRLVRGQRPISRASRRRRASRPIKKPRRTGCCGSAAQPWPNWAT